MVYISYKDNVNGIPNIGPKATPLPSNGWNIINTAVAARKTKMKSITGYG